MADSIRSISGSRTQPDSDHAPELRKETAQSASPSGISDLKDSVHVSNGENLFAPPNFQADNSQIDWDAIGQITNELAKDDPDISTIAGGLRQLNNLPSFLHGEISGLEQRLNAVGDDAQLANVDLQNILQKQQQTLQMMSNISKMLFDTANAIVRKLGG